MKPLTGSRPQGAAGPAGAVPTERGPPAGRTDADRLHGSCDARPRRGHWPRPPLVSLMCPSVSKKLTRGPTSVGGRWAASDSASPFLG